MKQIATYWKIITTCVIIIGSVFVLYYRVGATEQTVTTQGARVRIVEKNQTVIQTDMKHMQKTLDKMDVRQEKMYDKIMER